MSDRYSAQILIGGQVSRTAPSKTDPDETVLKALINAIGCEGLSNEYGGAVANPYGEDTLNELVDANGWLRLCDEQAINGEIPDLEEFCRTEGIPYSRNCCCYGGYLGENVTWTPEDDTVMILETDDGHEQIDGVEVRRAMGVLHRALDAIQAESDKPKPCLSLTSHFLESGYGILQGLCPDLIELPKFEVIP